MKSGGRSPKTSQIAARLVADESTTGPFDYLDGTVDPADHDRQGQEPSKNAHFLI
jgi:hypothetical protein